MDERRIQQAGLYGLVGVVLMALQALPYIGLICGIASLVLIALAHKGLSEELDDPSIFRDTILFMVVAFASSLVAGAMVAGSLMTAMNSPGFGVPVTALLAAVVSYAGFILSFYLAKKVFMKLYEYLNVSHFKTAGNLMFWGAVTYIIVIGIFLILVGWIFAAVGYNTLRTHQGVAEAAE